MEKDYCVTQLINGDGEFNTSGIENFTSDVKIAASGTSYAIVAVMGPQSSGKSTLMNHLFHTDFKEMNGKAGRNQTTLGIWIARCVGITPYTIAMDLEGSDGRERGSEEAQKLLNILMEDNAKIKAQLQEAKSKGLLPFIRQLFAEGLGILLNPFSGVGGVVLDIISTLPNSS